MTLNFKIHRGTKEIGGSCVEIWTDTTRILVDFGMPLVEKDGSEFDFKKYENLTHQELIKTGVLPDVQGIYSDDKILIDGLLISHPHQDHYGLYNYIHPDIKCYLGKATHKLLEINNTFTPQNIIISNPVYFQKEVPFQIGETTVHLIHIRFLLKPMVRAYFTVVILGVMAGNLRHLNGSPIMHLRMSITCF
jgi:ribonuclease J